MPKNLVVFSDGTGNQLKATGNTNVLRLHAMTREIPDQLRFYDPGVGTEGSPRALTGFGRGTTKLLGLAFGYGIKRNVVEAYTFLMRNWEQGDRIFLFGFSRGAYTVRALAGMLRVVGLLRRDQENLIPYALKLFWKGHGKNIDWNLVNDFTAQFSRPEFPQWGRPVTYLGVWDTVKAVGWFRRRLQLPYTRLLKSVETVRHSCSLDEWRAQYKAYVVSQDELNKPGRDIKEVWFAGVHSDVGGTFEPEHDLADITLQWIATGAIEAGLDVDEDAFASFRDLPTTHAYGEVHKMGKVWVLTGISHRRVFPQGAAVHESVKIRMARSAEDQARYLKKGVGDENPVEPWRRNQPG
jgi:uncharacterized protein (DUF2235 family)